MCAAMNRCLPNPMKRHMAGASRCRAQFCHVGSQTGLFYWPRHYFFTPRRNELVDEQTLQVAFDIFPPLVAISMVCMSSISQVLQNISNLPPALYLVWIIILFLFY